MDIISTVMNQLKDNDTLKSVGSRANAQPNEVQSVAEKGLPLILEGLNQRTNQDEKTSSQLASAVEKHEGDEASNLSQLLQKTDHNEGSSLLNMAFGGNQKNMENQLAKETGVDSSKVSTILKTIAPIALTMLAKRKGAGALGAGGLSSLLGGMSQDMRSQTGFNVQGMLSNILGGGNDTSDKSDGPLDKIGDLFK